MGGWWEGVFGVFLRFSMSFEFLSEMLDHSVSETRDPSLTIYVLMPLFHNKWVLSFKVIHILAPKVLSLISGESADISRPCPNWWQRICAFVGQQGGERVNEVSLNQLSSFPF